MSSDFNVEISSVRAFSYSCSTSSFTSAILDVIAASKIVLAFCWNSSESSSPARSASISSSMFISAIISSSDSSVVSSSDTTSSSDVSSSDTTSSVTSSSSTTTSPSDSDSSFFIPAGIGSAGLADLFTISLTCFNIAPASFNFAESSSGL